MNSNQPFNEVTPAEVKQRLDAGDDLLLVDVREPEEVVRAAITGAEVYPLSQAAGWIDSLPKDRPLVIFCHHGGRSAQVAGALAQRGHTNISNMTGGIDAWSQQIDSTIPRY